MPARQKENSNTEAKVIVRQHVLKYISELGVKNPKILDAFAAHGHLWQEAWGGTENYLGLELKPIVDGRRNLILGDNTRLLRNKNLDLESFDIFDLDAFGCPFYQFLIIAKRLAKSKKTFGFVLTDGTKYSASQNQMP
jgi:hypothetical protein